MSTSEALIHQLMARLEALERPRRIPAWTQALQWLGPAGGLAGMLLILGPAPRAVSIEALLLADGRESAPSQFALASEPPTADPLFGFLTEGQP